MKLEGRVWVFNDNDINTDLIFPGKYTYEPLNPEEQAKYAMEDYDPEFIKQVRKHDIIVTGKNFGCGSSREQAVTCLKHSGVDAIVAKSFARLFYRNSINSALAVLECPEVVDSVFKKESDQGSKLSNLFMKIDLSEGKILIASQEYSFPPWDKQAMLIFKAGGLVEYTKQRLYSR
ncbi:MAG: 3-isopropylmalate dehydratase [Candidatus Aminicenantes bacterium]|nr:MAG: 3-isopropylmalate dehydratase [Candidatus Aminicenantes bacterium]